MKLIRKPFTLFSAVLLGAYVGYLRPRLARWGTPEEEKQAAQPGDVLIPEPMMQMNHSVVVQAPPERVWPWIVQIGFERGGFYSYDRLERIAGLKGLHSATEINPAWQDLKVGDAVKIGPESPMTVAILEKNRAMVLRMLMSPTTARVLDRGHYSEPWMDWSWAFLLTPVDGVNGPGQATRLTSRVRAIYQPYLPLWPVLSIGMEPAAFLMDRKLLETVRSRAEGQV